MKESRSASQVLFGYLPDQTVDMRGGVWRVAEWRYPKRENSVDVEMLRRELCRVASPWRARATDGGFVEDLERSRADIEVLSLDREHGVAVEPFPRVWICSCGRIHHSVDADCQCGGRSRRKGQLQFVGYCPGCGGLYEPRIQRCPTHNQVRIIFPGTSSAHEIRFVCPAEGCGREIRRGFGSFRCSCGLGDVKYNVHRAAAVYTPRSIVLVNPPSLERANSLARAGGARRALAWVLDGMQTVTVEQKVPDKDALRQQLVSQGFPPEAVEQIVVAAEKTGTLTKDIDNLCLDSRQQSTAESQATTIALSTLQARIRVANLISSTSPVSSLRARFIESYPKAMEAAGVESVELNDKFPVLTGQFGFTRGSGQIGETRLRAFRNKAGSAYQVYADLVETEALFIRLSPLKVANWLMARGVNLGHVADARTARLAILQTCRFPEPGDEMDLSQPGALVTTLIHSFTHRFIRLAAIHAGIDRNALSELLVPAHLGFFVYAAARGDFVLGGLQAVFESELDNLLRNFVSEERRCPLDPGCSKHDASCAACLHLGEPSCRFFNRFLSRRVLFGSNGYLN